MRNRINELRLARGLSQDQLAKLVGTTRQTIFRLEKNQRRLSDVWLRKLGPALGADPGDLVSDRTPVSLANGQPIPVIDYVQAGDWTPPADAHPKGDQLDFVFANSRLSPKAFALEIRGTSMEPEFREGDRVIVDPAVQPLPGDYVVAKIGDEQEATFKKYRPGAVDHGKVKSVDLVPLNPDWPVLTIDKRRPGRICATMVEHHRYRRR